MFSAQALRDTGGVTDLLVLQFFVRESSAENRLSGLFFLDSIPTKSGIVFLLVFCFTFFRGQMVILINMLY